MVKNWKKKLIAILLIFTMTFSNFALVGKTYAAYVAAGIFGNNQEDTESANVEFDAYFKTSQDSKKSKTVISDIKSKDLNVGVSVKVKNSGYLKDAKILFGNGKELNFKVNTEIQENVPTKNEEAKDVVNNLVATDELQETKTKNLVEENDKVQSFENNELNLVQLNADSKMEIEFPISYEYKKFVEEENISKTNQIKFEGTYINENAKEVHIEKNIDLKLSWEDEREIETSSEITKYIGFNQDGVSGIILQNSIIVDSKTEDASLPIKDSQIEVSVPVIDGQKPELVNVVAKNLVGTTGKENDEVEFNENNWKYDSENNKITINVANKAELVSTQNENDILIDETLPKKDMYFSESGIDNYLITYTYKNVAVGERDIQTTINATLNEFGKTKLTDESEITSNLKDEVGQIVSYNNESTTKNVSKGYTYLNYNNEENKYEIEIDNKLIFNISYKDFVESLCFVDNGNSYVGKDGQIYAQDDLYYKSLEINKENFDNMLGQDGKIDIYDNNEVIYTINNEIQANENGIIEIKFEKNSVKNIKIETSKPVNDGIFIIGVTRGYSNVSYDKNTYKEFDRLAINTVGKAKYKFVDNLVDCGNSNLEVKLDDTTTEATLEIGQDSLSTLAMNNNVELKIELNNEKIKSDVYGNSKFQIKLPEYVETVEVTDCNIVYGEGLELGEVKGFVADGRAYIEVQVNGKQKELSSGIISNGTNIVLHANIKVDLFAPADDADFELIYVNDEATNYNGTEGAGLTKAIVKYSAPTGVVSVNSISGFSEDNRTITSVNQGKVQDEIKVYSESKIAKAELTIMNNEKNDISDIVILGRVPFEGVKDITTGDELGTTLTTRMSSKIVSEDMNGTEFRFYYSENGEASKDLADSANGWKEDINSLENVKSFLIVPVDSSYKMENASKLRFKYEYEIPSNLDHNEEIYGTFATFFTNNTEVASVSDVSKADLVGLVTSQGPEFDFSLVTNKEKINEYEELEITTTVRNKGKMTANNIVVTVPIPEYTTFVSASSEDPKVNYSTDNSKVEFKLASLDVNETVELKIIVKVEQFYAETDNDLEVPVFALISATDLDAILKTEPKTVTIEQAQMRVFVENTVMDGIMFKGCDAKLYVRVQNLTNNPIHNVVCTMQLADGFNFEEATVLGFADNGIEVIDIANAEYNEATRTVTWRIDEIKSLDIASMKLKMTVGEMNSNVTKAAVTMSANAKADETVEYSSGNIEFKMGRPLLVITQATSTTNSYVKEGETINYQFNVKNEGSVTAQSVRLVDYIPEGLVVKSVSYISEGIEVSKAVSEKDQVNVGASIPAGDTLTVDVSAVATSLNGLGERSVTNKATVTAKNVESINSNEITHIVEASGETVTGQGEYSTGKASSSSNDTVAISKTYKISGTAWLDKDNDGMRSDAEQLMKGVKATLVDSDNGVIKQSTVTNSSGEYTFTGVRNGNYIIIFDYDTVRYTVTVYQKENVAQNVNSDVITTKIEQDGQLRNGAVTRVVSVADGSVSNIDIGLVDALKFDLNLDMGISKITTKTSKATETKTYENAKLTKTEIAAKQVAGSSVYIEYTFIIKNEGEISGFAKKIADYIPEGMEFNSGMNGDWYTGSDGNLYTTQLANIEIQPGETKTFKLVLSKQLTDNNMGTISNTAEIVDDYNIYGVTDLDSLPGNKAQNEDDFARADSYLSVKTGEVFIYISVIITAIILGGIAVAIITLKIKYKLNAKGGV